MAVVALSIDASKVIRACQRAPGRMRVNLRRALGESGRAFVRDMEGRFGGDPLHSRTGFLKRSIGYEVTGEGTGDLALRVFSAGAKYANLQEYGGVIRPVNADWLTIPLPDAKTPNGTPKGRARDFENTFIFKSKRGNLLIAQHTFTRGGRRREKPKLLFVLKKEVRVPARLGFHKTWQLSRPVRAARVVAAAKKSIEEAARG